MAVVSPQQTHYPEPPQGGLLLAKLNVPFLSESYARLYAHRPKAHGASLPHPSHLNTKEALAKQILNWMMVHAGENTADCDNCNGPMDLDLVAEKVVPEVCVFCGVGPIEYESNPKNGKPEPAAARPEDDDEPEPGKAAAPPKKEAKKVTKKIRKTKSAAAEQSETPKTEPPPASAKESNGGQLVKLPPRATRVPKEIEGEVVSPEQRALLDGVEKVRTGLSGAMQGVYAEMWATGKWFAEVQKSKAWTKHPAGFAVWKEFVEGCFGVLVNLKRVDELVTFYKANPKEVPKLDGALRLPLPKVRNPRPREEREERGGDDASPAHDPKNISVAGVFRKKQTLGLLDPKGKPAKSLKDRPTLFLKSDNGVVIKAAIGHNAKGLIVATVTIDRE